MVVKSSKGNTTISLAQYTASILVIMIHCGRLFETPEVHFLFKSIICRSAVPLFLITTAFFYRQKTQECNQYRKPFFKKQIKTYLLWSLLYLPLGCEYLLNSFQIQGYLYPVAAVVALGYTGVYYHLWYLPALFMALVCTELLVRKLGYKFCIPIAILLFFFGAVETYLGWLNGTSLHTLFKTYQAFFLTTRNGLFMGIPYVLIGFISSDFKSQIKQLSKNNWLVVHILSICLLTVEAFLIFSNPGKDKNFMIMMLPVSFLIFNDMLRHPNPMIFYGIGVSRFKKLSRYYFFIHPAIIWSWDTLQPTFSMSTGRIERFIIIVLLTHTVSCMCIKISYAKKLLRKPTIHLPRIIRPIVLE